MRFAVDFGDENDAKRGIDGLRRPDDRPPTAGDAFDGESWPVAPAPPVCLLSLLVLLLFVGEIWSPSSLRMLLNVLTSGAIIDSVCEVVVVDSVDVALGACTMSCDSALLPVLLPASLSSCVTGDEGSFERTTAYSFTQKISLRRTNTPWFAGQSKYRSFACEPSQSPLPSSSATPYHSPASFLSFPMYRTHPERRLVSTTRLSIGMVIVVGPSVAGPKLDVLGFGILDDMDASSGINGSLVLLARSSLEKPSVQSVDPDAGVDVAHEASLESLCAVCCSFPCQTRNTGWLIGAQYDLVLAFVSAA